jgi:type VI secretion system secreted protein VgrG
VARRSQFPWDLDGKNDDRSSCWIRVAQAWAGATWGFQFIPRVGMEVLVSFLGGDQDVPVILGCAYNATHPVPFPLPDDQTRSGIRTMSSPDGDGFNELSFEDASGAEQVYLHAQRDLDEVVENNHGSSVRGNRNDDVAGYRTRSVGRDETVAVLGDRSASVGGEDRTAVSRNRTATVGGDDHLRVEGDASETVARDYALEVLGNHGVVVGDGSGSAQSDLYVDGSASMGTSKRLILRGAVSVLLECGKSSIELTPDGITLKADTIEINGSKSVSASGNGPSLSLADTAELASKSITIYSEKGSMQLDQNITIKAEKLMLNCDGAQPPADSDDAAKETMDFECKLSDYYLKPYAGKTYHLLVEGLKFEGQTDGDGVVKETIPKDTEQVLLKLWLDDYPTGRQRLYTFTMTDLPGADTPKGAQARLKHLGYYAGEPSDELDEAAKPAILEFQKDHEDTHGLTPTGELDGPTSGALEEIYGS